MRKLVWLWIFLVCLSVVQLTHAQDPRDETVAIITAPAVGEIVSGQVPIIGSASHPARFSGYELEFDNLSDSSVIWIPIGQRISQQVTNGTLQTWDTVGVPVPDGVYQLRLRIFLSGDLEPVEFVVSNIQVVNTAPTALPTLDAGEPVASPAPPTEGPTPTPLINQPATTTPRPTTQALVPVNNSGDSARGEVSINFSRIQNAFCSGAFMAIGFFVVFGVYVVIRNRLRPTARQFWWQIRNELDQDR